MNATPLSNPLSDLSDLYHRTSKHSHYQRLSPVLAPLLGNDAITVQSRFEHERLAYIVSRLPVPGLHVADIGGNTGFFAFEMLSHGARRVDYHEGNATHHDFVRAAADALGLAERLRTRLGYVSFEPGALAPVDATLLLNVLHHLGDDFGAAGTAIDTARQQMLDCLATLSRTSARVVLQLGFNWKGDRRLPLFDHGTKAEMIDFVERGTAADWDVEAIGVAERDGDATVYRDLSAANIARDDSLGEFRNRPIFVLASRHLAARAAG